MIETSIRYVSALATVASLGLVPACDDTAKGIQQDAVEAKQEVGKAVQNAKYAASESADEAQQQLRDFKVSAKAELMRVDAKLGQLKQRSENGTEATKEQAAKLAQKLSKQREELGKKIDALDVDARREWAERKSEFDRELAELGRDIDGALDSLGDDAAEATH
jgi:uncharacterized phage infection (PIP) family protein YhgE